ncbi:hypothetical protein pipiens_005244, partial [Culex pipiens pipiens]
MLRAAKATAEEEARKLENVRGERDKLCQAQRDREAGEWQESKGELVEIGNLWAKVGMQERENCAIEEKNGLLRGEIVKLTEELEQQRIFEEEEAKRLEEESSQLALTPIKISHVDMGLFKDPNDFPSITNKIEASRRTYENIFKRPEYMELKKFKSEKRVKTRKHSQAGLEKLSREAVNNQLAIVVPRLKIDGVSSKSKGAVSATVSDEGTQSSKVDQPPRKSTSMVEEPVTQPEIPSSKKPAKPSKQVATPAVRRQKLKPEKLDFRECPTPPKETKIVEKSTPTTKKRTSSNVLELTKENVDSMLSSAKRVKKSPITAEPPKPKKVTIDPKPIQIPVEPEALSPPAPPSPTPSLPNEEAPPSPVSEVDAAQPSPERAEEDDSNSGGSSPPRRPSEAFDGVSLGGSISSLELNDRDSISDLGFDLSPVGSTDDGSGGGNKRCSSPGMDFDFLNANSPAKPVRVASQKGSQPKKKAAPAEKSSDGFDFLGGGGGGGDDSAAEEVWINCARSRKGEERKPRDRMARAGSNKCPHLENVVQLSLLELCKLKKGEPCSECEANGPNLWICLQKNCLHIGCSEQYNDHSTTHYQQQRSHCIHMNLSSQRIWCYLCEFEVFLVQQQQQQQQLRRTSVVSNDSSDASRYSATANEKLLMYGGGGGGGGGGESCDSSCEEDEFEKHGKWNGLVGLQNIANTCYMNSAIQALSNSPPLTGYFLDCGSIIETDLLGNQTVSKPGLAKHYHKLIKEMWCKNRRYVVPSGILYGIRIVHPMFRGYQQHDTQEFLRCFMDQLHEELKEVTQQQPPDLLSLQDRNGDPDISPCPSPSPSQSEAEYETCDSGVSEQSSLSDDVSVNSKRTRMVSRSPSPGQRPVQSPHSRQQSPIGSNRSNSSSSGSMTSQQQQNQQPNDSQQKQKQTKDKLPERSIISDIFDGKLLSSVQCLTCDRVSTREETFQDLSLPIPGKDHLAVLHQNHPGMQASPPPHPHPHPHPPPTAGSSTGITCSDAVYPVSGDSWMWWFWNWPFWSWIRSWFWGPAVSLHDCMAAFFSADELKGDNMYSCEKCNKLRNGVKYSRVLALPEMLCVHLKRFRHDLSYSSKISSPVHFPLNGLDMRPYLHKDCKSEVTSYDLCAVICHHGTVGGGHYTSFAKHDPTGKWFEFDDQLVTQVSPEDVQNCEAYVLFYRKNNAKMTTIRAQASDLISVQEHASDIRFYVSRNWLHR